MADDRKDNSKRPDWIPDWFPKHNSLEYSQKLMQVCILLLAGAYLLYHLFRGRIGKVAATAAGAS